MTSRLASVASAAIDLSAYPLPEALEELDARTVFTRMVQRFLELDPTYSVLVEGDPAIMTFEVNAYRETLIRQRVNDALKAVLLPTSYGTNLDALGARFGVTRLVLVAEDLSVTPPVAQVLEDDESFRRRIYLAPEAWSGAGPRDAYTYHAYTAHGDVSDVAVYNHTSGLVDPGQVMVSFLARDGADLAAVTRAVQAQFQREDVIPFTDSVIVGAASAHLYEIVAYLHTGLGPDTNIIRAKAREALDAYLLARRKVGLPITRAGIIAALMVANVVNVTLVTPTVDVEPGFTKYGKAVSISLTVKQDA